VSQVVAGCPVVVAGCRCWPADPGRWLLSRCRAAQTENSSGLRERYRSV